jgi:hypothetical protein
MPADRNIISSSLVNEPVQELKGGDSCDPKDEGCDEDKLEFHVMSSRHKRARD